MTYFKKIGRLTDEQQAVVNVIEKHIQQKNIPLDEIPECNSLDDLLEVQQLVMDYESTKEPEAEKETKEVEHTEEKSIEPTEQTTTELDDVSTELPKNAEDISELKAENIEQIIESEILTEDNDPAFGSGDYDPFDEEIIERSYNTENEDAPIELSPLNDTEEIELEQAKETPLDDLPPNTKKRAAEQTADTILKGYSRMAPIPFKWLAKVNEEKVDRLAFEGQLDISIEVSEGMTFEDYMKQTNEQVDEIFTVEQDTIKEIREPLIEVLMEQELELTPQQRLLMAVVSHLFQMFTAAFALRMQNNRILKYQKQLTAQKYGA